MPAVDAPEWSTPRVLVVVEGYVPAQPTSGHDMRRAHTIRAAVQLGQTDVFVVEPLSEERAASMATAFGVRVGHGPSPGRATRGPGRQASLVPPPTLRKPMTRRDRGGLRICFQEFSRGSDITVLPIYEYLLLSGLLQGAAVIELSDLPSDYVAQTRKLNFTKSMAVTTSGHLARVPAVLRSRLIRVRRLPRALWRSLTAVLQERRWKAVQRNSIASADLVMLSNADDARALGYPTNAIIVPNGFDREGLPVGSLEVQNPPVVGFWGAMSYAPNGDGASWLVREVLPLLHEIIPDARVLLAGRGADQLSLVDDPRVEVVGFVDDLSKVLRRVDVAAVPLRLGTGTRIKIVEAWAHRIPVVSTSIGAYGLGSLAGRELIVGDSAREFATALARLLTDLALRAKLIEAGTVASGSRTWVAMEATLVAALSDLLRVR